MNHLFRIATALVCALFVLSCSNNNMDFPHVDNGQFIVNGQVTYYVGTNAWYAGRLSQTEEGKARLEKELDLLCSLGIKNIRITATEGEDLDALEMTLEAMRRHGMHAVLFMNNAWEWSYGFADYLEAAGAGAQPKPSVDGYWPYMQAMAAFSTNKAAQKLNQDYIAKVVERFKDNEAIFSWQICNEPRCFSSDPEVRDGFIEYLHTTAALIKSIDPKHMVSTGSEGYFGSEEDWALTERVFDSPDIDYITAHIWPYNWSWVSEETIDSGVQNAISKTEEYINGHLELAKKLDKPVVIEEFGYPRDGFKFSKTVSVNGRNDYYTYVFGRVVENAREGGYLAGCNFWAWGGLAEQNPESDWYQEGDDFCGDPPQEQQGLNSVYASDNVTVQIIKTANEQISQAVRLTVCEPHDWLYIGSGPHKLPVKVDSPLAGTIKVNLDLVADLSLMSEIKDTVLHTTSAVKSGSICQFDISKMEPGFYQVNLSYEADGICGSVPTFNIGFNPEEISSPQDKQPDFDEFWTSTLSELASVPMDLKMTVDKDHSNDVRTTYIVEAKSLGGEKMGGILCVPVKEGTYKTYIDYMGYGADVFFYDPSSNPDAIEFLVSVRDQGIFRDEKKMWIDRGLADKNTFYYRGAFCDVVRAVDIIASLDKADKSRIFARGESQGGAFTFISASLDSRIAAAAPAVPFLGDYRHYSQIVWWPVWEVFEAADKEGIDREALFTTLSYFDVKNFTDRVKCPVYMAFGLQDPTCPPHTNFSEYNLVNSDKSYYCAVHTGHGMWQVQEWSDKRAEWFKQFENK